MIVGQWMLPQYAFEGQWLIPPEIPQVGGNVDFSGIAVIVGPAGPVGPSGPVGGGVIGGEGIRLTGNVLQLDIDELAYAPPS
jgi:hypothetical protein